MPYSSLDELLRERVELMIDTQRDYGWGSQEVRGMKLVAIETTGIELKDDGESTVCHLDISQLPWVVRRAA